MNKIKKIYILLLTLGIMFGFSCCTPDNPVSEVITADLDYSLVIPHATESEDITVEFSMPVAQLCTEEAAMEIENSQVSTYTAGEDAIVSGQNTEQLDGMLIDVEQSKLKDCIEDEKEYIETLVEAYNRKYDDSKTVSELKKQISDLIDDYYLITAIMTFSGTVSKDVKVDAISINELNHKFEFENFTVKVKDIEQKGKVNNDDGECIDINGSTGIFSGYFVGRAGYYLLEGEALKKMHDIEVESLSDNCITVNKDNYYDVCNQYDFVSDSIEFPVNSNSFKQGESINEEYEYIFTDDVNLKDGVAANLLMKMKDTSGNEYWRYICMPSVREGKYLLISELIEKE